MKHKAVDFRCQDIYYERMTDLKFWVIGKVYQTKNASRYAEIAGMWKAGIVMEDIAAQYGVTRQRIHQILKRQGLEREDGGKAITRFRQAHEIVTKQRREEMEREGRCRAKWGMSIAEYKEHIKQWGNSSKFDSPLHRFIIQRKTARCNRKIAWELTFAEWWKFWQESGHWEERGRGKGYGMSRYGDSGPYKLGNIYICTSGENFKDSYLVHSADSRTFKRGMGKKGYYRRGKKFFVVVGSERLGSFKTAKEARAAYKARWAEKYSP